MGFCNTTFIVAIQGTVAWHERGVATGSQMFMRMIGMSVGAALFGAIVNFGVHRQLPGGRRLRSTGCCCREARGNLARSRSPASPTRSRSSAQDAFLVATLIAAGTLVLVLAFPRGLSPTRSGEG